MGKTKLISKYEDKCCGETVTVKVMSSKEKKIVRNREKQFRNCPECGSTLSRNEVGVFECTGNKLRMWYVQFIKYNNLSDLDKIEFLRTVSDESRFEYLFNRWAASQDLKDEKFDCGYTNRLHSPISDSKVRVPDPLSVKHIERRLGRKLTEEEQWGEHDLWTLQGQYLTKYKKDAKRVKIAIVVLPNDVISRNGI